MMLEIQDLHVQFHTRNREAVSGVSLMIHDGEILGLVGESGSGKSVTAMAVAGLLPRRQCRYSGRILLDGTELLHADRAQLRRVQGKAIGVVFQEPMSSMDPLMKVGRQVEEVLELHTDLDPQQRRQAALEALAAVEEDPALGELAKSYEENAQAAQTYALLRVPEMTVLFAGLFLLGAHIKIHRTPAGKWEFLLEHPSMQGGRLEKIAQMLASLFRE